jgi:hypothetical protein
MLCTRNKLCLQLQSNGTSKSKQNATNTKRMDMRREKGKSVFYRWLCRKGNWGKKNRYFVLWNAGTAYPNGWDCPFGDTRPSRKWEVASANQSFRQWLHMHLWRETADLLSFTLLRLRSFDKSIGGTWHFKERLRESEREIYKTKKVGKQWKTLHSGGQEIIRRFPGSARSSFW